MFFLYLSQDEINQYVQNQDGTASEIECNKIVLAMDENVSIYNILDNVEVDIEMMDESQLQQPLDITEQESINVSKIELKNKMKMYPNVREYEIDTDSAHQLFLKHLSTVLEKIFTQSYLFFDNIGEGCSSSKKRLKKFKLQKHFHEIIQ